MDTETRLKYTYAVYKIPTLVLITNWKERMEEGITCKQKSKKAQVEILILEKKTLK